MNPRASSLLSAGLLKKKKEELEELEEVGRTVVPTCHSDKGRVIAGQSWGGSRQESVRVTCTMACYDRKVYIPNNIRNLLLVHAHDWAVHLWQHSQLIAAGTLSSKNAKCSGR